MKTPLLLLSLIIGGFAAFIVSAQERAEAPSYNDGDLWHFRVARKDWQTRRSSDLAGDYEVIFSEGKFRVFSLSGTDKTEVDQGAPTLLRMTGLQRDQLRFLQFPLVVGNRWRFDYHQRLPGERNASWTPETRVIGIEEVTTLAGVFRAFRIERDFDVLRRACWTYTYFYSPNSRSIVKYHYDGTCGKGYGAGQTEMELIKFGASR